MEYFNPETDTIEEIKKISLEACNQLKEICLDIKTNELHEN